MAVRTHEVWLVCVEGGQLVVKWILAEHFTRRTRAFFWWNSFFLFFFVKKRRPPTRRRLPSNRR